jgi:5-methylcytosine-specific restriction endonuclease McrA
MTSGWNSGSSRRWRELRAKVLARDGHTCQLRIDGICTHRATHVHHLDGKRSGDNPDRLVAACAPCNLHVGDPTRSSRTAPPEPTDPEPLVWHPARPNNT